MAAIADVSIPAAEIYLLRFCLRAKPSGVVHARIRDRPLLEFAQYTWNADGRRTLVLLERPLIEQLTAQHFDLISHCAEGFGQLFVWFPPRNEIQPDEARLLTRAGVNLNFASQKIGVYNRGISKYNN